MKQFIRDCRRLSYPNNASHQFKSIDLMLVLIYLMLNLAIL